MQYPTRVSLCFADINDVMRLQARQLRPISTQYNRTLFSRSGSSSVRAFSTTAAENDVCTPSFVIGRSICTV